MFSMGEFILRKDILRLIIQDAYKAGFDKCKEDGNCDALKFGWDHACWQTEKLEKEYEERELERIRRRNMELNDNSN